METIYKYVLDPEKNYYKILKPARILSVESQQDTIVLYALVDTEEKEEEIYVDVVKTGDLYLPLQEVKFMNTVKLYGDNLVFHVFVDKEHFGLESGWL